MSYSNDTPATSKQKQSTGTGKRRVTVPSNASNQLRIGVNGELKSALNNYSSITLAPISNLGDLDPRYSKKSPGRTVGKRNL